MPSRRRTRRLLSHPAPTMYALHTFLSLSLSPSVCVCACVCVSTSLSLFLLRFSFWCRYSLLVLYRLNVDTCCLFDIVLVCCFLLFHFVPSPLHSFCWSVWSICDYSYLSMRTMIRSLKLPEPAVMQARSCMRPMLPLTPDMWRMASRRRTRLQLVFCVWVVE